MARLFKDKHPHELTMTVLRFAVGSVFLWFGIDKFIHPSAWLGWIPDFVWKLWPQQYSDQFLYANGIFEVAVGLSMVAGKFLRVSSAAAGFFLVAIALTAGVNEVTIRDNALIGTCMALYFHADAKATSRKLAPDAVSAVCSAYLIYLFVYGVLYLRTPA